MTDTRLQPQLYLVTPPVFDLAAFVPQLAACLDGVPVACLRLALAGGDDDTILRAADACRELAHARDVPLVIERHAGLVDRLGLDGVHLTDGARSVRAMRKELGADAIIGAFCGLSRHDGLAAGEAGADYISFGPVGLTALAEGQQPPADLFAWWSDMIELPVVAEGGLTPDQVRALAPHADFFAVGPEVWSAPDALTALRAFHSALAG